MLRIDDIHGFAVIEFEGSNPVSTLKKYLFYSPFTYYASKIDAHTKIPEVVRLLGFFCTHFHGENLVDANS
jgi:hypothetical protein